MRPLVAALLVFLFGAHADAEPLFKRDATPYPDNGVRIFMGFGYPGLTLAGIGYKFPWHAEVLLQGGYIAIPFLIGGTGEVEISQDVFRRRKVALRAGLAGSIIAANFFSYDDCGPDGCVSAQTIWFAGPRFGARFFTPPGGKHRRGLWAADISAGPNIAFCRGFCPSGQIWPTAAVELRAVIDWLPRK